MSRQADELPGSCDAGEQPVWRDSEVAQNALWILELKQRVLDELEKSWFPDLEFLFSPETIPVYEMFLICYYLNMKIFLKIYMLCLMQKLLFKIYLNLRLLAI